MGKGKSRRKKVLTQIAKENGEGLKCERSPTGTEAITSFQFLIVFLLVPPLCPQTEQMTFYLEKSVDSALPLPLYLQQTTFWLSSLDSCSVENLYSPDLLHCSAHQAWEKWGFSASSINYCRSPSACGGQQS